VREGEACHGTRERRAARSSARAELPGRGRRRAPPLRTTGARRYSSWTRSWRRQDRSPHESETWLSNISNAGTTARSDGAALARTTGARRPNPQRAAAALGGGIARGRARVWLPHRRRDRRGVAHGADVAGRQRVEGARLRGRNADRAPARGGVRHHRVSQAHRLDFNEENPQAELDRVHAEVCAKLVRFVAEAAAEEDRGCRVRKGVTMGIRAFKWTRSPPSRSPQPRRRVPAGGAARRALDAGRGTRDEPVGDRLPAARGDGFSCDGSRRSPSLSLRPRDARSATCLVGRGILADGETARFATKEAELGRPNGAILIELDFPAKPEEPDRAAREPPRRRSG